jgi:hypothetical protein
MKSFIALVVFFLVLWGILGLTEGIGFIGGIKVQIQSIWNFLGLVGRILVIVAVIGLFVIAP